MATPRPVALRAVGLELDHDVAERVATAGHRRHLEVDDRARDAGGLARSAAIAASIMPLPLAVGLDLAVAVGRARRVAVGCASVPPCSSRLTIENRCTMPGAELLGDDRLEVGLGDLDLAVGQLLEADERLVQRVALHVQAHLLQRVGERVAAGVLAQHDLRGFLADGRRVDDLVGLAVVEHAVLVDAGLVRERVAADDRLVVLHG